jgi:hypothetical protein
MDTRATSVTTLQVSVHRLQHFTSMKVTGTASLEAFSQLILSMGEQTRLRGDKRVLVDLLEVAGDLKFTEHFKMGEQVARRLQHLDKVASVVPPEKLTRTSEKTALKQGFQLRVFTSMNEAIHWLTQDATPVVPE